MAAVPYNAIFKLIPLLTKIGRRWQTCCKVPGSTTWQTPETLSWGCFPEYGYFCMLTLIIFFLFFLLLRHSSGASLWLGVPSFVRQSLTQNKKERP